MEPSEAPLRSAFTSVDEALMVERLAAFDACAWRDAFEAYHPRLFRFAFARIRDRAAAEDIAAQTLEEAVRGIGRYRHRGVPFSAWLYRIAGNIAADYLKDRGRRPQVEIDTVAACLASKPPDLDSHLDLASALDCLTEEQRTVLVLRFMNDCSIADTASITGRSEGSVKQLQHRAVRALRSLLEGSTKEKVRS